jgi:hypothetical protein
MPECFSRSSAYATDGSFHSATVTISGPFDTGTGIGDGDAYFIAVGGTNGTALGAAAFPADSADTLAQRLVNAINASFVGICAAPVGGCAFRVTLSPVNGFTLDISAPKPDSSPATESIAKTGDIAAGNEGTWQVDASQASPLNRAFTDYLTDFATQVKAAGQTMTVAFSQELLAPPDQNTASAYGASASPMGNRC